MAAPPECYTEWPKISSWKFRFQAANRCSVSNMATPSPHVVEGNAQFGLAVTQPRPERRAFSIAITAWPGEVLDQLDLLIGERCDFGPEDTDHAYDVIVLDHRHP